jgi:hypothetical protein
MRQKNTLSIRTCSNRSSTVIFQLFLTQFLQRHTNPHLQKYIPEARDEGRAEDASSIAQLSPPGTVKNTLNASGSDLLFPWGQESQLYVSFIYITGRAGRAGPLLQSITGWPLLSLFRRNCLLLYEAEGGRFHKILK